MHDARRSVIYIFYGCASRSDPTQSACDGRARLIGDKIPKQSTQSAAPRGQVLADDFADFVRAPPFAVMLLDLHTGNKQKLYEYDCALRRWFSRILMELRERGKKPRFLRNGQHASVKRLANYIFTLDFSAGMKIAYFKTLKALAYEQSVWNLFSLLLREEFTVI
jgi:hypothetical protein